MGEVDFKPGSSDRYGKITDDGCCPCCLGPCYGGCEPCDGKEGDSEDTPSCCTGRCCTCFPGSLPVINAIEAGDPGTSPWPPFSEVELEASFFLAECRYNSDTTVDEKSPCNGYLGSITLCGGDKLGPAKYPDGTEVEGPVDALCIRKTDSTSQPASTYLGQNCRKQICNQKNRKKQPEKGGLDIYEIWCGAGRICYENQTPKGKNGAKDVADCTYPRDCTQERDPRDPCGEKDDDDDDTNDAGKVDVGQFVEMSICCCKGNDDESWGAGTPPDCHRGLGAGGSIVSEPTYYNCKQIKEDIKKEKVDIDQVCSCACYTVDFKFHDVTNYPYLSVGNGPSPPPTDKCWRTVFTNPTEECVTSVPGGTPPLYPSAGCPTHSKCPMEITDCRCMDIKEGDTSAPPQPEAADGWYICAEYDNPGPLVCSCCAGYPDLPTGGPPGAGSHHRGGCKSGNKIRVFITVKEDSKARENPRGPSYCPTCSDEE